ncbi:MAG: class I SAM-dependent methyltransferase [Ardenticatenales bacterium]|nr:class I SAM-dependent methyltransferase [Ardenticatenales bacterium]
MRVHIPCGFCGSEQYHPHITLTDRLGLVTDEQFHVVSCAECTLLRLNPRPTVDELGAFYPDDYAPFEQPIQSDHSPLRRWMRRRFQQKRVRAVRTFQPEAGRALDVGCATGLFLEALRSEGWQVQGVELNERAATFAREQLKLDVFCGTLEDAPLVKGSFDVITLWHVLEHLPEPAAALSRLYDLLAPGGTLVLTVPNAAGWDARLWGPWWAGWDAPRHLYHFTPHTLEHLLNAVGFGQIRLSSFTDRHGVWVLSAAHWAQAAPTHRLRALWSRVLGTLPAQVLSYPYFTVAERFNSSSAMTFFAQKGE